MTLSLPLTPELEARLRRRAAAAGKDVAEYLLYVVEEDLAMSAEVPETADSPNQWEKAFDAWAAGHPRLDTIIDDSRESIYEDRGE